MLYRRIILVIVVAFVVMGVIMVAQPWHQDALPEQDVIQSQKAEYGSVVCTVVSVYDGDTFVANIDEWPPIIGHEIGIRVAGVDTPEMNESRPELQKLAQAAKEYTEFKLSKAQKITLTNITRDKYFRILANVSVDDRDLGEMLIRANLGKLYEGGTKPVWSVTDYKRYKN